MSRSKNNANDEKRRTIDDWKRPEGPPNVWRIVEGRDAKISQPDKDGVVKKARFSIQEVPKERYNEAIEHMAEYFVADEATCKSLKFKEDPHALNDFRSLWDYLLKIGISVGAYRLDENDEPRELAGVNILYVETKVLGVALRGFIENFKSIKARKLFEFMNKLSEKADARDIYGVDTYVSALGLSVAPAYRGQKLGVRLLEARDDIGRNYGIAATTTIFSAPASQIQAERAGFECALIQNYDEVRDENGEPLFPNIEATSAKIMMKRLR